MLEFVGFNNFGTAGAKRLEYDVNITKNLVKGPSGNTYTTVRIGLRNDCMDRIKDKFLGIAFDKETKTLYLIPENTLTDDQKKSIKLYKVGSASKNGGNAIGSCNKNLLNFVTETDLWGFHNIVWDAQTRWFKIEANDTVQFVK